MKPCPKGVAEARETASEAMAGARDSVAEAVAGARESVSEAVAGVRGLSAGTQGHTPTTGDDAPTADHQETTES